MILKATDFSPENPFIRGTPRGNDIHRQILHIYDARGNEFEHAVEMTGRLYTMLALFMHGATHAGSQNSANSYVQKGIEYISSNYSYAITVEDIAGYVGVSRSHLFRSFEAVLTTLISGISGQLYKQFALTIAASTVILIEVLHAI